jgi:ABC-type Fe3+-hydroxamate transport system substrate-binding protein
MTSPSRRHVLLGATALTLGLGWGVRTAGAQGSASPASVTVRDAAGRSVIVAAPASRVVLLFNYEEFAAIAGPGAFDRVAGFDRVVWHDWRRSIWDKYVAALPHVADIADIGDSYNGTFSVEKVIALKPQVMIAPKWAFDALGSQVAQLEAAGIPTLVINYNAMTVPTHVASTLAIGAVMGTQSRADDLATLYKAKVADVVARVAKANRPPPKVYVELGMKGPGEYDVSFAADQWGPLIGTAGGDNIAKGKIESEAPLSAEYVLASDPDYIFIAGSNWADAPHAVEMGFGIGSRLTDERLNGYKARPGWSGLKAIKNGNLYAIHHGIARTLFDYVGMQFIAKAMYPDQFADIDPEGSLRDYFAKYLPVAYEGTWLLKAGQ